MSFLGPAFLLGLLGISLPVIIHLLKRRRLQVVAWAAHRFLQASLRKHKRRIQLEDTILLILRCLVVALLALAFARPVFERSASAAAGQSGQLVLLVDVSSSMGWTDGVNSLLDRAAAEAERELASSPAGTAAALVAFTDRVHPLVARPTADLAIVRRELSRLEPLGRATDLAPALRSTLDLLASLPPAPRRIVVLGDQQQGAWRDRDTLDPLLARAREAGIDLVFRSVAPATPANLAVTRLAADADQVLVGQPVRLQAEVFNGGATAAANVRVTLHADDAGPVSERLLSSLAPGARATVEFTYVAPDAGFQPLTVRVPPDPLAADDARSLVVRVSAGTRALLVEGPAANADSPRPGFFLSRALVPVPLARRDGFPVKVRRVSAADFSADALADIDVVLLAGVTTLAEAQAEALARRVRAGAGLWVFPPTEPDYRFYNESAAFAPLLPAVTGAPVEQAARPVPPPYAHPLVDLWNEPANGDLGALSFRTHFTLAPRAASPDAGATQPVLRLGDGTPLLLAHAYGRGRVLQSAVPADATWSDLPLQPVFVPLVQRGLAWLAGNTSPTALAPGDTFTFQTDPALLGAPFTHLAPGEKTPLPAGVVELVDGRPSLRLSADAPGIHRVYPENGDKPIATFAVNLDPAESDLTPAALPAAAGETGSASGTSLPPILSRDLWILLATAVLLLAAAELVLSQRFSRAK